MTLSIESLVGATHDRPDPLLPSVPVIDGLRCQDHATFVAAADDEAAFRAYWSTRGLQAMDPLEPLAFPARHIAFAARPGLTSVCEDMIGLSVSDDPRSPVNELVRRHGGHRRDESGALVAGRLQHVALAVDEHHEMAEVCAGLEGLGVRFMTPILTFSDDSGSGASLQQAFVACTVPYGPFVEIVKRGPGVNGEPFQGFDTNQIDTLYHYYSAYSQALGRAS